MKLKQYIQRGIHYIRHGQPVVKAVIKTIHYKESLDGRTALITGGTSGIGFKIAECYLNAGATVVITGRNIEKLKKAKQELLRISPNVYAFQLDNCKVDSFDSTFKKITCTEGIGKIDILVNNAGILGGNIKTSTVEEYDKVMDANLRGVFFLSRIFARYLIANNIKGNILNIASSSSLRPADSAYNLSKWGVRGLTLGLAKSLIPYGITVNGIAPGPTATPMMGKTENIVHPTLPLGRYITPEEIANMAVVMVSDMGKSIIGDIVYMTGGAGIITFDDAPCTFK